MEVGALLRQRRKRHQRVAKLRVNPDEMAEMAKRGTGRQDTITEWMEKLLGSKEKLLGGGGGGEDDFKKK